MGAVRFFFAFWVNISEQSSLAELALAAEVVASDSLSWSAFLLRELIFSHLSILNKMIGVIN